MSLTILLERQKLPEDVELRNMITQIEFFSNYNFAFEIARMNANANCVGINSNGPKHRNKEICGQRKVKTQPRQNIIQKCTMNMKAETPISLEQRNKPIDE